MLFAFLLVFAVCIDSFATSLSYGISRIKIPVFSAVIISAVGTSVLGISILSAKALSTYIDNNVCITLSVILLFFLGVTNLFQNSIKAYLRKHKGNKKVSFSFADISFFINIILEEATADFDNSKTLSSREAFMLAIALSIDSLATGFSAGLSAGNIVPIILLCFIIGLLSVMAGGIIGERLSKAINVNMGWLSGVILIILALIKFM